MMYFLSFLALLGKLEGKNLLLNVFVQVFGVFLFLNPFLGFSFQFLVFSFYLLAKN